MENIQILPGIPLGVAQLEKLEKLHEENPAAAKVLAKMGNQVTLVTQQQGIPATPNTEGGTIGMFSSLVHNCNKSAKHIFLSTAAARPDTLQYKRLAALATVDADGNICFEFKADDTDNPIEAQECLIPADTNCLLVIGCLKLEAAAAATGPFLPIADQLATKPALAELGNTKASIIDCVGEQVSNLWGDIFMDGADMKNGWTELHQINVLNPNPLTFKFKPTVDKGLAGLAAAIGGECFLRLKLEVFKVDACHMDGNIFNFYQNAPVAAQNCPTTGTSIIG